MGLAVVRGSVFLVMIVAALSLGCGGEAEQATGEGGPGAKDGLVDLADMLKELSTQNKPLPTKVADLAPLDPFHPAACAFIQNGSVVYLWGKPLGSGDAVIAYEKTADAQGGWVLLQDGTVKKLTADEFKAAKKA